MRSGVRLSPAAIRHSPGICGLMVENGTALSFSPSCSSRESLVSLLKPCQSLAGAAIKYVAHVINLSLPGKGYRRFTLVVQVGDMSRHVTSDAMSQALALVKENLPATRSHSCALF